ncbi:MAG: hypothetical protein OXG88_05895 [Gammaproteobacteria bacterium]|nr:hypothetical protein [Gammaproteobacteria bacterium]MCY3726920.1 hypothetical protein [Paracoccaceae bacterium]
MLNEIQPWGLAPTPLVPRAVSENLGYLEAPPRIKKILGNDSTIADLYMSLWDYVDSVNSECLEEIIETIRPKFSSIIGLPIYSDKSIFETIDSLPFSFNTNRFVSKIPDSFTKTQFSFADVIKLGFIGVQPTIEFACIVEAASISQIKYGQNYTNLDHNEIEDFILHSKIKPFFHGFANWVYNEHKHEILFASLPEPRPEWPLKLKRAWKELGNIESKNLASETLVNYQVPELITQGLEKFDERLLIISLTRILVPKISVSLENLGFVFGVSRERIRQLEQKALIILEGFRNRRKYLQVIVNANSLSDQLGSAVKINHSEITKPLNWLELIQHQLVSAVQANHSITNKSVILTYDEFTEILNNTNFINLLLLWLAGPYKQYKNWLLRDLDLPAVTIEALCAFKDQRGHINQQYVHDTLSNLGIRPEYHNPWLEQLGKFLQVKDGLLYLHGSNLDKAYALLKFFDKPMTVEQIIGYLGKGSVASTRQGLMKDPRFLRINVKNEFVLAESEGFDEFSSIFNGIKKELEFQKGEVTTSKLIKKLSKKFGVRESSIKVVLSTPKFNVDKYNIVTIRNDEDCMPIETDLTNSSSCYLIDQNTWCLRIKVDKHLLRGSGRSIPNAFSQLLGCEIGNKIKVPSKFGKINISWRIASPTGATIGSLKMISENLGAEIGDYLFLIATSPIIAFRILKKDTVESAGSDLIKLSLLLGVNPKLIELNEVEAINQISKALDINIDSKVNFREAAKRKLISRGEDDLADLIPISKYTVDEYIENIGQLF